MVDEAARVERILVTRLRYLGDVVLSTPLLAALREAVPQARIEYLTLAPYAPVLWHHPWVDAVHALPEGAGPVSMLKMARRLSRPRVDWWIDLYSNPRSALLCALSQPRISVGGDRGLRSRVFDHRRGSPGPASSAVRAHLDKLAVLVPAPAERGVLLAVSAEEKESLRRRFPLDAAAPIVLHPGATWPSKAWPVEKWTELARRILRRGLGPVWIVSAPGEETLSQRVASGAGDRVRVLPVLPLRELMALLAQARAFVGNDGGILHCAVGVATPTVGIFGPTEREIWFPHEPFAAARLIQESVPCQPCHRHACDHLSCLVALPVSRVMEGLEEVLTMERPSGPKV